MKVHRISPTVFNVTLHAYELATLVSGARWIVDGADGELQPEAVNQLRQVLASYEAESRRLARPPARVAQTP